MQANHRVTTTVQRRIYGRATNVVIRPLDEERAVQAASDILGELFVFIVAGIGLMYEVHRSSRADARKEEQRKQELEALKQKNQDLERQVGLLNYKLQFAGLRSFSDFFKLWRADAFEEINSASSG